MVHCLNNNWTYDLYLLLIDCNLANWTGSTFNCRGAPRDRPWITAMDLTAWAVAEDCWTFHRRNWNRCRETTPAAITRRAANIRRSVRYPQERLGTVRPTEISTSCTRARFYAKSSQVGSFFLNLLLSNQKVPTAIDRLGITILNVKSTTLRDFSEPARR